MGGTNVWHIRGLGLFVGQIVPINECKPRMLLNIFPPLAPWPTAQSRVRIAIKELKRVQGSETGANQNKHKLIHLHLAKQIFLPDYTVY